MNKTTLESADWISVVNTKEQESKKCLQKHNRMLSQ